MNLEDAQQYLGKVVCVKHKTDATTKSDCMGIYGSKGDACANLCDAEDVKKCIELEKNPSSCCGRVIEIQPPKNDKYNWMVFDWGWGVAVESIIEVIECKGPCVSVSSGESMCSHFK